jgi:GTP-binding protein
VDAATLKQQMERLKRAIKSAGPALPEGEKPRAPVVLSAATRLGVTDVLRALMANIAVAKKIEAGPVEQDETWQPLEG